VNVLVTAASRAGATLEIAEAVAARLRHHGFAVTVAAPDGVADIRPYGGVIVGSAVYRGRWLAGARDFVTRHRAALGQRPVWLFSSGPVGDPKSRLGRAMAVDPIDLPALLEQTNARDHRRFPGKLARADLGWSQRIVLRLVPRLEGDRRDWSAVEAWADEIAAALAHTDWFERMGERSG
jgi:menaquinone-dependent protoporphyrinogen oxidase